MGPALKKHPAQWGEQVYGSKESWALGDHPTMVTEHPCVPAPS